MARRVAGVVLALITALLAVLAVPLGLVTAAQDRRDFQDETVVTAGTLANLAEERIGDGVRGPALGRAVADLARAGEQVAVYDAAGRKVAGTAGRLGGRHLTAGSPAVAARRYPAGDRLLVTAPIVPDSGTGAIGTVALSRSTATLQHRIMLLWTLIGAVSAAGLLAAAVAAVGLARWASRPLTTLADAARHLGRGALGTRARVSSGPPEVRRLAASFNAMAGRLQSLVEGHQSMMAEVSHQLRTPLAALRLRLDLLAQDADEATSTELAGAQEEIARLTRLVSGLLAMARAENVTAAPAAVDVDAVVADRASAWRPAAEERGVTLTVSGPEPAGALACAGHLEQILDNLLANALDALPAGGTITVTTAARPAGAGDGRTRIAIADDGRGMTEQQQRAAFRRFATSTPGGTGLGLAIVHRLAVANGGSATLSDTPGGGLTVTIELPAAAARRAGRRPSAAPAGSPGDINQF
jgi:signal transduction histidine kinase